MHAEIVGKSINEEFINERSSKAFRTLDCKKE